MPRYKSFLIEVPYVASSLQEISKAGMTIVSSLYISDGQQVLLIVQEKPKPLEPMKPISKMDEESEADESDDEED